MFDKLVLLVLVQGCSMLVGGLTLPEILAQIREQNGNSRVEQR